MFFPKTDKHLPDGWTVNHSEDLNSHRGVLLIDGVAAATYYFRFGSDPDPIHIIADQHRDLISATLKRAFELERADFLRECAARDAEADAKREAVKAKANAAVDAWISKRGAAPFGEPKAISRATLKSTTAAGAAIWRGD